VIAKLKESNAAEQIETGAAWIGSPDEIADQIARCRTEFGVFEHASLQVNFNTMPLAEAQRSMRLFARAVMPRFASRQLENPPQRAHRSVFTSAAVRP
jgi:hypothetical protein